MRWYLTSIPVAVHTPVVCGNVDEMTSSSISIIPTKYKSLILGRTFTVSVGTAGTHLDEKGYGTREYRKYVKARQVKFPFRSFRMASKMGSRQLDHPVGDR